MTVHKLQNLSIATVSKRRGFIIFTRAYAQLLQMADNEKDKTQGYRIQVIVALIGLTGVIGVALIENWDNLFSSQNAQNPVPAQPSIESPVTEPSPDNSQQCIDTTAENLLQASQSGDLDKVQNFLSCGVDPNSGAVWQQELPVSKEVMEITATPIHAASWNGHAEIVQVLIEAGANINALDEWGFSPLMAASEVGNVQVVRLLVRAGAEVNFINECQDCSGETALTLAAQSGYIDVVELLLRSGVDTTHQTDDGLTALDLAKQANHSRVVQLLQAE